VIFNFEKKGLVKLDRCGVQQWTSPNMTHHSISLSADGSVWVPGMRYIDDNSRFPVSPPYIEESILKISPEGKVLLELSILELLFENHLESEVLFANGLVGIEVGDKPDVTHLNDVEELSPQLAPLFPMFAAGDLLVSERDFNLLMVVDPATRKIKWHQRGPWLSQHDPDFQSNSRIGVLSNNNDLTETGSVLGGSTIIELDIANGTSSVEFGAKPDQKFFTKWAGAQQQLGNQNRLIVESYGGRIFEVNRNGVIVWEYINGYDKESSAVIYDAVRYPPDYFDVTDWSCKSIE
jgi:Arylsulfotransferase (ASST)